MSFRFREACPTRSRCWTRPGTIRSRRATSRFTRYQADVGPADLEPRRPLQRRRRVDAGKQVLGAGIWVPERRFAALTQPTTSCTGPISAPRAGAADHLFGTGGRRSSSRFRPLPGADGAGGIQPRPQPDGNRRTRTRKRCERQLLARLRAADSAANAECGRWSRTSISEIEPRPAVCGRRARGVQRAAAPLGSGGVDAVRRSCPVLASTSATTAPGTAAS